MEKLCYTCKHWGPKEEYGFGMNPQVDARYCNIEGTDTEEMKADEFAIICCHDGPVYTGSNFGCIHWEAIDK